MAICDACAALNDRLKDVDPHPSLVQVGSFSLGNVRMGQARGYATHYLCTTCGTKITRTGDTKDPLAGWFITKAG